MDLIKINENIPKAILKFAVPSIIAMILTSTITIIDGFFIGNYIGKSAISAVNLGLPMLYIFLAVGIMVGVGGVSAAGRLLGAKKKDQSITVFNQTILMSVVLLSLLSLVVLPNLAEIANVFHVESAVKQYFFDYYLLMLMAYPVMMINVNLGMFVRAEGKPEVFMLFTVLSVIINIVLDYLFIVHLGYGITGIALASVISILTGLVCMLSYFFWKSKVFKFRKFTYSNSLLFEIFKNGSSEFIGQLAMCITTIILNFIILKEGGVNGVAAFAVVGYSAYLFSMITIGFGQGASPLISFANGANAHTLGIKIRKLTTRYVSLFGVMMTLLLCCAGESYSRLFVDNSEVGNMVSSGSLIFSVVFLFMGFNIITSFYFTSVGNAKASALISASRGVVILMICIFVFPALWGMTGVWFIAPTTEFLTLLLSLYLLSSSDKKQSIAPTEKSFSLSYSD